MIDDKYSGRYIGTTDIPLSDKGREELLSYDNEYIYPYASVVFTSPLKRCKETCEILYPDIKPLVIDQLSEMNFGEWEGKSMLELSSDENFKKWISGDREAFPPRGESGDNFLRRICLIFEDIVNGLVKTGTTDCVIVTHGGIINNLLAVYGLPQAEPYKWQCDHGFGYSLKVTPMLWQRDKVLEVYAQIPMKERIRDDSDI